MVRSSMLISVILLVNLFVGSLTFITMPTQESWLPLSSTIMHSRLISNAFAESVENQEEKGEGSVSANQDDNGNGGDNTAPSVEGNDNDDNNGKNENNDGKEQEE